MKKWLVIQSNRIIGPYGYEDCEFLRECWSLQYAIKYNWDNADVWGLRHGNYADKPNFNNYDYILIDEQYEFDWIPWEEIGNSTAMVMHRWTDINVHPHDYFKYSKYIDLILSPSKTKIIELKAQLPEKEIIWFPSAIDDRYFTPQKHTIKLYDSLWLGSKTRKYTEQLEKEIGLVRTLKSGYKYIEALNSTKVFVNSREWGKGDIPYKNFEAIGLGTCVVCDYDESYEELGFKDGVNCYFFNSYEECKDKVLFALKDSNWEIIGKKGLQLAPKHSYKARIERLNKYLKGEINGLDF